MIQKFLVLFALLSVSTAGAYADTTAPLFTATSDAASGAIAIKLLVSDDGAAKSILYSAKGGPEKSFDLKNLATGIVLYETSRQQVAVLQGIHFDLTSGGPLTIDYLYNGLSGERRRFDLDLERTGGVWATEVDDSAGRRVFTKLFLKAKIFLGQIVGIASISPSNESAEENPHIL